MQVLSFFIVEQMLRYLRERPLIKGLVLAMLTLIPGTISAATIDYGTEPVLTSNAIDLAPLQGRTVALGEIIAAVENQTQLKFLYNAAELPMTRPLAVPADSSGRLPLARLFTAISMQVPVVFNVRGDLVAIWAKAEEDKVATAALGSESMANVPTVSPEANPTTGALGVQTDDVVLLPAFEAEAGVVRGSAGDLRSMRQKAVVSVDYMSATDLSKFSAGDLAEVVFRMPGVSVADGQFAVVRGLSDRFLSTTLNGLKLPSPDPEKQAFQLDLIPTSAVESVVIAKAYEAKLWAESTGGAMTINTRAIPDQEYTKVGAGIKWNSNTADGILDYKIRGNVMNERFGFGAKSRLGVGEIDADWQYIPSRKRSVPLGTSFSIEHANVIPITDEQSIGLLFSLSNSASYKSQTGTYKDRLVAKGNSTRPSGFELENPYPNQNEQFSDYTSSSAEYTTTSTLGLGYQLSENHRIQLSSVWVQTGYDEAHVVQDSVLTDPDTGVNTLEFVSQSRAYQDYAYLYGTEYFRERDFKALQLAGEHEFQSLGSPAVNWALQRALAAQKDHPYAETAYGSPLNDLYDSYVMFVGNDSPTPLRVVWAENEEVQSTGRFDITWKFGIWGGREMDFSVGAAMDKSDRESSGFGLTYAKSDGAAPYVGRTPNEAMRASGVSAGGGRLGTVSFPSESSASKGIKAYYVQTSIPMLENLTLSAGARFEDYTIAVEGSGSWGNYTSTDFYTPVVGYGLFLNTTGAAVPPFQSEKWYPAASLKWDMLDSLSLRLAYSRTDGRPSFRELSPFFNKSIYNSHLVIGNPTLTPSEAVNYDARLEYKPSSRTLLSLSYFSKRINRPIEKFLLDTRSLNNYVTEVFVNNPGEAKLNGVEFEYRQEMSAWTDALRNFSFGMNYTHIVAEVPEHPSALQAAAVFFQDSDNLPATRRLYDQPEYIANFDVTWKVPSTGTSLTLSAYAISDTLSTVGLQTFTFDIYDRAYVTWDMIFSQSLTSNLKLKLSVKNLTDPVRGTVHDRAATTETVSIREYRAGRDVGLSMEAKF